MHVRDKRVWYMTFSKKWDLAGVIMISIGMNVVLLMFVMVVM